MKPGASLRRLIHPPSGKVNSAKFACKGFSEVRAWMVSEVKHDAEYRNSASATAGEDIAAACHIRLASGVYMFRTTDKGGDMTTTTRIPPAEITGIKGALM